MIEIVKTFARSVPEQVKTFSRKSDVVKNITTQIIIDSPPEPVVITHFVVIGQSQAGGYNNQPALTTSPVTGVRTLTSGPLDPNVAGSLVALVEGDTFSDTNGPAATANVETIATSMAQQLKTWRGGEYLVTVHAKGGTTIQELSEGGSSGQYEEAIQAIARVKTLVEAEGKVYNCHLIFFHGGTGGTGYEAAVEAMYANFLADVKPTYTTQANVYMFTHQQRPIGSPDYGIAQYNASKDVPNIIMVGPEYALSIADFTAVGVAYQGDAVHLTAHGTRYLGMLWARAINKTLTSPAFEPLELDIANAVYNGTNKITVPILNGVGAISKTSNAGIEVYSNTTAAILASTTAVVGTDLEITLTTQPLGQHSLTIRTGLTANGALKDSSASVDIPSFNGSTGSPYNLDKYMVRALYNITVFFPVNLLLNFGGPNAAADPAVSGTISIWDSTESTSNETYTIQGSVQIIAVNTVSNYWGFESAGIDNKAGTQTVTGTNFYANAVLANFWFVENRSAGVRLQGLNPAKTYTIKCAGLRSGTATLRQTNYTIGGTTILKTSNRSGTASVYTTDAENAVFSNISPDVNGHVLITVAVANATQFGYLNALEITEN